MKFGRSFSEKGLTNVLDAQPSPGCKSAEAGLVPTGVLHLLEKDHTLHPPGHAARQVRIYIPDSYNEGRPLPLVFDFPGLSGTSLEAACDSGLTFASQKTQSFIVVHLDPDHGASRHRRHGYKKWTWWHFNGSCQNGGISCSSQNAFCHESNKNCTPCDWTTCNDDVGYIEALQDRFEDALCIDQRRIYHSGMSSGGMMAIQTGTSLSHRVAAVFTAGSAITWGWPLVPTYPVALVMLTGTRDRRMPANASLNLNLENMSARNLQHFDTNAIAVGTLPPAMTDGPREQSFDQTPDSQGYFYQTTHQTFLDWSSVNDCDWKSHHKQTEYDGLHDLYCVSECTNDKLIRCTWSGEHNYFAKFNGIWTYNCDPTDQRQVNWQHGLFAWSSLKQHVKPSLNQDVKPKQHVKPKHHVKPKQHVKPK
jgi:poly(3-hydroxybutyrate) depolymerase